MKFEYKKYGPTTFRPVIPVEVCFRALAVDYEVLIDSGADSCVFDRQIADILDISMESGSSGRTTGIGGASVRTWRHKVKLKIGGWEYDVDVDFADLGDLSHGIVGQLGFFEHFKVKFEYSKKEIELIRNA